MKDFLFHNVSEKERQQINAEAKKLMNKFSKKLSSIGKIIKEPLIERETCEREEGKKVEDNFSKKIMFENAPHKNKNSVIAEKKKW